MWGFELEGLRTEIWIREAHEASGELRCALKSWKLRTRMRKTRQENVAWRLEKVGLRRCEVVDEKTQYPHERTVMSP
jgi:hypothetical protein